MRAVVGAAELAANAALKSGNPMGPSVSLPSPDWSQGLIVHEPGEEGTWSDSHGWSKFLTAAGEPGSAAKLRGVVAKLGGWVKAAPKAVPAWPPNNGFLNAPKNTTLPKGTIIDRYGKPSGQFVAPDGTPFPQRSLPPGSEKAPYKRYEVLQDIENVQEGTAAPWFGQPGGGTQYRLPDTIEVLRKGEYIRPID